jgi:hypothetical protein
LRFLVIGPWSSPQRFILTGKSSEENGQIVAAPFAGRAVRV